MDFIHLFTSEGHTFRESLQKKEINVRISHLDYNSNCLSFKLSKSLTAVTSKSDIVETKNFTLSTGTCIEVNTLTKSGESPLKNFHKDHFKKAFLSN